MSMEICLFFIFLKLYQIFFNIRPIFVQGLLDEVEVSKRLILPFENVFIVGIRFSFSRQIFVL